MSAKKVLDSFLAKGLEKKLYFRYQEIIFQIILKSFLHSNARYAYIIMLKVSDLITVAIFFAKNVSIFGVISERSAHIVEVNILI